MFHVIVRATSVVIKPGKEAMSVLTPLINLHTYEDEFQDVTRVLGFIYDEQHDVLYFHRGIDIQYLRKLLVSCDIVSEPFDPYVEMKYNFEEVIPPRDDDQQDCIDFIAGENAHASNINDSQIFLVKKTGFGKAEPYTRKIPTPTPQGYTLMGDLKVGDYVFDQNGKPTKVTGVFDQGERPIYEITFSDGRHAYCADEHLWKVFTYSGKGFVLKTKDLLYTYRFKHAGEDPTRDPYKYRFKIPVCKPVEFPKRNDLPIDPWVLGCFIGNGCCRERPLTISACSAEIPNKIAEILGYKVKKSCDFNYSYVFYNPRTLKPIQTEDFFAELPEFIGAYSYHKRIPQIYLTADKHTRLSILQGLMDTDGHISVNENRFHIGYTSTSEGLLHDIQQILYSFGWSGRITPDQRIEKYTKGFCGVLTFRIPNEFKWMLFRTKKKLDVAKSAKHQLQDKRYNGLLIKNIRYIGDVPCRCIMVDNPEHLYLTEDFIVTHNTFCTGYAIGLYNAKALIVTHRDNLRDQWVDSLINMNGYPERSMHEITTTAEFEQIATGRFDRNAYRDIDIFLITHATFRAGLKRVGDIEIAQNFGRNLGIGLKVIDEAHLEFRDTILLDIVFNVRRNLYITATDGRSSKDENSIFRHVFSNTTFYQKKVLDPKIPKHPDKWVEYITVDVNTHVKPNVYRFRVAGGKGMSAVSYGKWVIAHDPKQTHFKACVDIVKQIYKEEPTAKILLFMPLIELCTECAYFLIQHLNYDESFDYDLNIKTVNSHNSKSENEINKRADIIVTTIQSLGTGSDIKGVTDIINCSPIVSKIVVQQVLGRIRYIPKKCHYYDIVDQSVPADRFWWKSRSKTLKRLCTNSQHISWVEEEPV